MLVPLLPILLAVAALSAQAQDPRLAAQRFEEGNRLLQEGRFESSLEKYREAEAAGYASGALFYNMGNAFFRIDEMGQAIRYYEKARPWMPKSSELAHNLMMARERTMDSFARIPDPFWRTAWHRVVDVLSPTGLYRLGLAFYALAVGALAVRIRRGRSPWVRRTMTAGGALAALFLILGLGASYERANAHRAVVLDETVTLLEQPNGAASDIQVHEGTIVDVLDTRAAWSEIRLPNGTRGWMSTESYGTI